MKHHQQNGTTTTSKTGGSAVARPFLCKLELELAFEAGGLARAMLLWRGWG